MEKEAATEEVEENTEEIEKITEEEEVDMITIETIDQEVLIDSVMIDPVMEKMMDEVARHGEEILEEDHISGLKIKMEIKLISIVNGMIERNLLFSDKRRKQEKSFGVTTIIQTTKIK